MPSNPRSAWYAWRTAMAKRGDPRGDDPLANYEYGFHIGQRMTIERTASWSGIVPLLQDVLDYLIELAIERDMDAGVDLTGVNDRETGEHTVPGVEAVPSPAPLPVDRPDLTVGDTSVQQGAA